MSELRVYIEGNYSIVRNGATGDIDSYLLSDTGIDYNEEAGLISVYDRANPNNRKKALWSDYKDEVGSSIGANATEVFEYITALFGQEPGDVSDGDKGDITVSGNGETWTINDDSVGFAKIQNIPTNRVLARSSSGVGSVEDLTLPQFRTLINVEDGSTADQTDVEIETAYNNQVSEVSQVEAETGTSTTVRRWTALRVAQAIASLGGGGGSDNAKRDAKGLVAQLATADNSATLTYTNANIDFEATQPSGFYVIFPASISSLSSATTFSPNGITAKPITNQNGGPLNQFYIENDKLYPIAFNSVKDRYELFVDFKVYYFPFPLVASSNVIGSYSHYLWIEYNNTTNSNFTIDLGTFESVGEECYFETLDVGEIVFVAGTGVTINKNANCNGICGMVCKSITRDGGGNITAMTVVIV